MPARATPITRRALVTGSLAGAALLATGCDPVGDLLGGDDDPGVSGAVTPTAPAVDADSDLVAEVATAVASVAALATATGTSYPPLAATTTRLARLHAAHLAELGGAEAAAPPAVAGNRATALQGLEQAETRLQDRLVQAAGTAESGALALLLASMAAAVAQQRVAL